MVDRSLVNGWYIEPIEWSIFEEGERVRSRKRELAGIILCQHDGEMVFGDDFILTTFPLKDRSPCFSITYIELLMLERPVVYDIVDRFPRTAIAVRKAEVSRRVTEGHHFTCACSSGHMAPVTKL